MRTFALCLGLEFGQVKHEFVHDSVGAALERHAPLLEAGPLRVGSAKRRRRHGDEGLAVLLGESVLAQQFQRPRLAEGRAHDVRVCIGEREHERHTLRRHDVAVDEATKGCNASIPFRQGELGNSEDCALGRKCRSPMRFLARVIGKS